MTKPDYPSIIIDDDTISIEDRHGEIVRWVSDEWAEDPSVVVAIARYIVLAHEGGAAAVRAATGNFVTPDGQQYWRRNGETNAQAHARAARSKC